MASHALSDKDLELQHKRVKQDLEAFKGNASCLDYAFESAAKHMPVYLKIVKSHIMQLEEVLKLEAHNQRNLENAELAEPVIQLIQLFRDLDEEDIQLLEQLSLEARNWDQKPPLEAFVEEITTRVATEA